MKTNHTWALIKLEANFFARFLFFPAIFAAEIVVFSILPMMDGTLFAMILTMFGGIAMFWSYGFLFQDGRMGFRSSERKFATRSLEFPFSRAFDRGALFGARSLWFFASSAIPLVVFVIASFWHPDRTIQINRTTNTPSAAVQEFYLTHFRGAVLRTSPLILPGVVNRPPVLRSSIFLPHAQIELAVAAFWAGAVAAALYQALMLGMLRFKWCQWLLPILLFFIGPSTVMAVRGFQMFREMDQNLVSNRLPVMDRAEALAIQNPFVFLLIGAAMIGLALRFSCRQFIRQEALT